MKSHGLTQSILAPVAIAFLFAATNTAALAQDAVACALRQCCSRLTSSRWLSRHPLSLSTSYEGYPYSRFQPEC